ncbi:DUF4017 family protein [Sutcliffiella rhizosphaerae]|uniref:DUF4017 domain-containing protein n=1 Tax=Sutcliffiella rhizosphaerae TaxID=2880967 RepID=A0ABN8AHB2_9BACI|nr:DUF4017 family protein [Sutcliffiella rhizosphaerae]CAG9623112.1 hypothetical protein BACCIP111883_03908 [Sutcliffiella rhizosphaerae]
MKKLFPPLFSYLLVCIIVVLTPASEGYNTFGWKLFVAQMFAIPVLIIVALITFYVNKRRIEM